LKKGARLLRRRLQNDEYRQAVHETPPNKANQHGLPKVAPLRSASFGIRLFATLGVYKVVSIKEHLENLDLDAIAYPEDKFCECQYFYSLLQSESDRDKFRWLLSAFLGACYSFLEIKAKSLYFAFSDPETGEYHEDQNSLDILKKYIKSKKHKNNPSRVSTYASHELIKTLYDIRHDNTHNYAISIMRQSGEDPEKYLIGHTHGDGVLALTFCREILFMFKEINQELHC